MIYDYFKEFAENNGWIFEYGRRDYLNLYDEFYSGDTVHLFLEPVTIDSTFSDVGNESKTYTGKFMLIVSSNLNEDYDFKYTQHIKPLMDNSLQLLKDKMICDDFTINKFQSLEVIDILDFNLDGLLINYNIELNE